MVLTKDEATKIATRAREIEGELMKVARFLTLATCDLDPKTFVHRAAEAAELAQWAAFRIANCLHVAFDFEMPTHPGGVVEPAAPAAKENGQC